MAARSHQLMVTFWASPSSGSSRFSDSRISPASMPTMMARNRLKLQRQGGQRPWASECNAADTIMLTAPQRAGRHRFITHNSDRLPESSARGSP